MASICHKVPLGASNSMRLLKLFLTFLAHDTVKFELLDATLDQCLPFEAISYGQTSSEVVSCSGQLTRVTQNYKSVLQDFAVNSKSTTLIQIDAICFDQSPAVVEHNHRVDIMGMIYNTTDEVVVWLAPKTVPPWERESHNLPKSADTNLVPNDENHSDWFPSLAGQIDTRISADDMLRSASRFHRVWVVQEVSLSHIATIIYKSFLKYFNLVKAWPELYSTRKDVMLVHDLHRLLASYGISRPETDYTKPLVIIFMGTTKGRIILPGYVTDDRSPWVPSQANPVADLPSQGSRHASWAPKPTFGFVGLAGGSQILCTKVFINDGLLHTMG
ncbi:hypothetical protein F5Y04DRAFT_290991 [Hypomontagnella monticulosa]|nr:hypothetical protein F5Y04DRAFT_290991 [Hypomontagnella monticulosa]